MAKKQKLRARPRKGNVTGTYHAAYWFVKPFIEALGKPRWLGIENLPKEGPFIAAPNHMSNLDPIAMGYFLGFNGFEPRFLAKQSIFKIPVMGPFLQKWGMIPVLRESDTATDSLEYARQALEDGDVIVFYFEGTLTRDPALWPMKGKTGLARVALDTRVPVVPIVHWGVHHAMDRYAGLSLHRKRPEIFVKALPPVDYSDLEGDSADREAVRELTNRIQEALRKGAEELRREVAPKTPWDPKQIGGPSKDQLAALSKWRSSLARGSGTQDILPATPEKNL